MCLFACMYAYSVHICMYMYTYATVSLGNLILDGCVGKMKDIHCNQLEVALVKTLSFAVQYYAIKIEFSQHVINYFKISMYMKKLPMTDFFVIVMNYSMSTGL